METQLLVVTAVVGIFITVIIYVSKIFAQNEKDIEEHLTTTAPPPPVEIHRKKSESVRLTKNLI